MNAYKAAKIAEDMLYSNVIYATKGVIENALHRIQVACRAGGRYISFRLTDYNDLYRLTDLELIKRVLRYKGYEVNVDRVGRQLDIEW